MGMLVLTREPGQRIKIGDDITILFIEFRKSHGKRQIRLGIEAPKDVRIMRAELGPEPKEVRDATP